MVWELAWRRPGDHLFRRKPAARSGTATGLFIRRFYLGVAPAAATALTDPAVEERIGPSLRLRRTGAAGTFIGLLENRICEGILLPFRQGEERRGDRQGTFVEFERVPPASMMHQYGDPAFAADTRGSSDPNIV